MARKTIATVGSTSKNLKINNKTKKNSTKQVDIAPDEISYTRMEEEKKGKGFQLNLILIQLLKLQQDLARTSKKVLQLCSLQIPIKPSRHVISIQIGKQVIIMFHGIQI